jgi:aminoglycoside phosphotransferase (APT) family kinase protein
VAGDDALRVKRVGDTVHRPLTPWSTAVHAVLHHLEAVDFPAPRVLAVDHDAGIEVLTWIEGASGPDGWAYVVPEDGLRDYARFLRRLHDALHDYDAPASSSWSRGVGGGFVCHGDPGPWNAVFRDGQPFALIDFDHAHAGTPLDDVLYALQFCVPFRDDEECVANLRYPAPPKRGRRVEVFCEAYGIDVPPNVRDLVADRQDADATLIEDLAAQGLHPQVSWVRDGAADVDRERARWTRSASFD